MASTSPPRRISPRPACHHRRFRTRASPGGRTIRLPVELDSSSVAHSGRWFGPRLQTETYTRLVLRAVLYQRPILLEPESDSHDGPEHSESGERRCTESLSLLAHSVLVACPSGHPALELRDERKGKHGASIPGVLPASPPPPPALAPRFHLRLRHHPTRTLGKKKHLRNPASYGHLSTSSQEMGWVGKKRRKRKKNPKHDFSENFPTHEPVEWSGITEPRRTPFIPPALARIARTSLRLPRRSPIRRPQQAAAAREICIKTK